MSPRKRARVLAQLTPEEIEALEVELEARERESLRYRDFVESPDFCGLEVSPLVAAIMDASQGVRPETIDEATCERYFGCGLDSLPKRLVREVAVQAGGRGGKTSRLVATKALHAAWTVPLPTLRHGEHALALIVSSNVVFARQALRFCAGYVEASPVLSKHLVGEVGRDSFTIRRPDGKLVDVAVRAAGAKGKGGRAFTLVFAAMDEACFFYDDSGVVNDREIYRACIQRVVPQGQLWMVSTPWVEDVGLLEEKLKENWGSHETTLAVRGVGTRALNPGWDPDGTIESALRKDDPDNAAREIDAVALVAGSRTLLSREALTLAVNARLPQRLIPSGGVEYYSGGDTGFVKNSSSLVIVEKSMHADGKPRFRLAAVEEAKPIPGLPLQPRAVIGDFAKVMATFSCKSLVTDTHEKSKVVSALLEHGLTAVNAPSPEEMWTDFKEVLHEGRIELSSNPRLLKQLKDVMAKPLPGGGVKVVIAQGQDGSHGDLAVALARAVWHAIKRATAAKRSALDKYRDKLPKPRM